MFAPATTPIRLTELGHEVAEAAVQRFLKIARDLAGGRRRSESATIETCGQIEKDGASFDDDPHPGRPRRARAGDIVGRRRGQATTMRVAADQPEEELDAWRATAYSNTA